MATGCTARKSASMERRRCAGGTSVSMYMPMMPSLLSSVPRSTWRSSSRVGWSAEWRSSITRRTVPPESSLSVAVTASKKRKRSLSGSPPSSSTVGAYSLSRSTSRESSLSCQSGMREIRSAERDWKYRPSASAKGWNGATGSSSQRPHSTSAPSASTAWASSATRRVLPMPGSPSTSSSRPSPSRTDVHQSRSTADSRCAADERAVVLGGGHPDLVAGG